MAGSSKERSKNEPGKDNRNFGRPQWLRWTAMMGGRRKNRRKSRNWSGKTLKLNEIAAGTARKRPEKGSKNQAS
jgi:hypothetical protein